MSNFFKKFGVGARLAVCTAVAGFISGSQTAFAQTTAGGNAILDGTQSTLAGLVESVIRVVQTLLAIAAIVSLFVVIYNIWKQERDAAQKAIWWVVGFAAGWAGLMLVGNIVRQNVGQ